MPLHPSLDKPGILPDNYRKLLNSPDKPYRDAVLRRYFEMLCRHDKNMLPGATPRRTYYKGFAQTLRIDLVDNLIDALDRGVQPELPLRLEVAEETLRKLGYKKLGSPQDFLYSFTSQRSPKWSSAIAGMGFRSAVMIGKQHVYVTMAPRYFDFSTPDLVIQELSGAIANDFWETGALTGSEPNLKEMLDHIFQLYGYGSYPYPGSPTDFDSELAEIKSKVGSVPDEDGYPKIIALLIEQHIEAIHAEGTLSKQLAEYNRLLEERRPDGPDRTQEQIVLKYVQDGNLLQKLLGGHRVDHMQSNVKGQTNPWRKSGGEIDSIYRVVGRKAIVLLEAKANDPISRSQLYQIYETYRLKMPKDWEVIVVGALLYDPTPGMPETVRTVIDMAIIKFDDQVLGRSTESILNMTLGKHYRWLIHQD
jgi:hypothetical protein